MLRRMDDDSRCAPRILRSIVEGIRWPAVPSTLAARLLAILYQLERSQWWSAEQIREVQFRQLRPLVEHAYKAVPFYRRRFEEHGVDPSRVTTDERWSEVPILTRRDVQTAAPPILADEIPDRHGSVVALITSGSTGQPLTVHKTEVDRFFWDVFSIRDHIWFDRDPAQVLASIRYTNSPKAVPPHGEFYTSWSRKLAEITPTGPACVMSVKATVEEQADWLQRIDPGYLLLYPSTLEALAEMVLDGKLWLPSLIGVRTFGEIVEPRCREACRRAFGLSLQDGYSSQELGYIAIQCPHFEHFHVQAENVLVEVLDDAGRPCEPGEVGRLVITNLHNFATPLLRYDIGDYAEVGDPCECGRGLPVLRRVMGRKRNLVVLPDGRRRWPGACEIPADLPPLFQFQLVQRSLEIVELRVVRPVPFSPEEQARLTRFIQEFLGHPFRVEFRMVDQIPRSPSGKFEEFISEVATLPN